MGRPGTKKGKIHSFRWFPTPMHSLALPCTPMPRKAHFRAVRGKGGWVGQILLTSPKCKPPHCHPLHQCCSQGICPHPFNGRTTTKVWELFQVLMLPSFIATACPRLLSCIALAKEQTVLSCTAQSKEQTSSHLFEKQRFIWCPIVQLVAMMTHSRSAAFSSGMVCRCLCRALPTSSLFFNHSGSVSLRWLICGLKEIALLVKGSAAKDEKPILCDALP